MTAVFRAAAPGTVRVVPLDDLTALYHRASGMTHLVASPVPELLAALAHPRTLAQLAEALSAEFDLVDGEALSARLDELVATGLVERA